MADGTKIEWADATLNYVNGCSLASPGCTNCYAMKQAHRFPVRQGLTTQSKGGMVWTGEVRENPKALEQALAWKRGRKIFWNAHGDLFHESVPDEWIDKLFMVFSATPQHTHMVLTKRSARMREYFAALTCDDSFRPYVRRPGWANRDRRDHDKVMLLKQGQAWPLPNVWLGASVEDQKRADERREDLRNTPAAVRFVSYEPALGPVDWTGWEFIDWMISGGESGPKARPSEPKCHIGARDFCEMHRIAYLFKQWGEWLPISTIYPGFKGGTVHLDGRTFSGKQLWDIGDGLVGVKVGKKAAGRRLHGIEHNGFPETAHG